MYRIISLKPLIFQRLTKLRFECKIFAKHFRGASIKIIEYLIEFILPNGKQKLVNRQL